MVNHPQQLMINKYTVYGSFSYGIISVEETVLP